MFSAPSTAGNKRILKKEGEIAKHEDKKEFKKATPAKTSETMQKSRRQQACRAVSISFLRRSNVKKTIVSRIMEEDTRTLSQAREELKCITGKAPHPSTMKRFIVSGVRGRKLEAVKFGLKWITSRQAIVRFIDAVTQDAIG